MAEYKNRFSAVRHIAESTAQTVNSGLAECAFCAIMRILWVLNVEREDGQAGRCE